MASPTPILAAFAMAQMFFAAHGLAQNASATFTTLYDFQSVADGKIPYGNLVQDAHGVLYGVTYSGGTSKEDIGVSSGYGTVYSLTPPASSGGAWTEAVIYSFKGGKDGFWPKQGLTMGKDGALYGATYGGGDLSCNAHGFGCGVVFRLAPPASTGGAWRQTVLHSFTGGDDGMTPSGSLALGSNGELYGTTAQGGNAANCQPTGCGVAFALAPPTAPGGGWTESILYSFDIVDGDGGPDTTGLVIGSDGSLYGTTVYGGASKGTKVCTNGCGTIFQLTPPGSSGGAWTESEIYSFSGTGDGGVPGPAILGSNGALFGATGGGGASGTGVVYELAPPSSPGGSWVETVLYNFAASKGSPKGVTSLVFGGSGELYATTYSGGKHNGGTLIKLTPPASDSDSWQQSVLYGFPHPPNTKDTAAAGGLLLGSHGGLFGITTYGGSGQCEVRGAVIGCGTVFELQP